MHPDHWLEDVFGTRANIRLLRLLAREPRKHWTEREAAAAAGMSTSTAHVALRRLARLGILEDRKVGTSHTLRLDPDVSLTADVRAFFDRESEAMQRVRDAIRKAVPEGVACYLFGSTAKGTTHRDSDVDMLVVAKEQDTAEEAAVDIRFAVLDAFPRGLQIIALGKAKATEDRLRPLLKEIRIHGERLSATSIDEVLA